MVTSDIMKAFDEFKLIFHKTLESLDSPYRRALGKRDKKEKTTGEVSELIEEDLPLVYGEQYEDAELPVFNVKFNTVTFYIQERGAKVLYTNKAKVLTQFDLVKYIKDRVTTQCNDSLEYAAFEVFKRTPYNLSIPANAADPMIVNLNNTGVPSVGDITFDRLMEAHSILASRRVPRFKSLYLYTNFSAIKPLLAEMFKNGWVTESGRKENKNSSFMDFNILGIDVLVIAQPYVDVSGVPDKASYLFTKTPGVELIVNKEDISLTQLPGDAGRFWECTWTALSGFNALPGERIWKINPKA